jgi:hypothetical protein
MTKSWYPLILLFEWLGAFVYCVYVAFAAQSDIPKMYSSVLTQVFETFGPTLAAMLTFVFVEYGIKSTSRGSRSMQGLVAIVVCGLYLFLVVGTVFQFAVEKIDATMLIERIEWLRLRGMPIVAIITTYYFVSRTVKQPREESPTTS